MGETKKASKSKEKWQETIESGVAKIRQSEGWVEWANFLKVMRQFLHQYSINNVMLIYAQNPNATMVAGASTWRKLGRKVNNFSKKIWIKAGIKYTVKKEQENPVTGEIEEVEEDRIWFKPVYVFDIADTDGEPLPSPCKELSGNSFGWVFSELEAIAQKNGLKVMVEEFGGLANGTYFPNKNEIQIQKRLSENQQVKTLIHELAHALLEHGKEKKDLISRERKEIEAESVAYIVCSELGLDSSDYSFAYLATWSKAEDFSSELSESGDRIQKVSGLLIKELESSSKVEVEAKVTPRELVESLGVA